MRYGTWHHGEYLWFESDRELSSEEVETQLNIMREDHKIVVWENGKLVLKSFEEYNRR